MSSDEPGGSNANKYTTNKKPVTISKKNSVEINTDLKQIAQQEGDATGVSS
jgi:hypothetical protein